MAEKKNDFCSLLYSPLIKRTLELLTEKHKGKHFFRFVLKDEIIRQFNKKTYKAVMSWLRSCRREVEKELNFDAVAKELDGFFVNGWYIKSL